LNRTIEVIVSPVGETKIEAKGFAGAGCRDASRFIEQALGAAANEVLTAEFYQQQATGQTAMEGQA
jgi:hypothetical protein